ncbi:trichothecene C-15 hydroxylase [Colletotrichum spaethianum]|uniref:Trichothecene C-15 hydroxylase n=1 Tax=Colletotrichum spaethianum TaxID=700344 RepID=A0AA37L4M0_9PEZI|nr:trichothecene C-15 hydroxylase [Colletotrichum spaethianum]GKT40464.1 trichothecene C-15 hydroxylase [Colletotrichum spaethianum]
MPTQPIGFTGQITSLNMIPLVCVGTVSSAFVYLLGTIIYNVYFHSLRRYPGPKLWAATRIPYTRSSLSGQVHRRILELHQEYGPIVRIAPNELAYNHPDAWKDVHGHLKNGTGDHGRDPVFTTDTRHSIIGANRENHSRFRRALSHGFSAQSMFDQESIIEGYVDLLIRRLHEQCAGEPKALNMVSWYNWTTFDIIGDLAFGEPFHCLDESDYHPWVKMIFDGVKAGAFNMNARRYPLIERLLMNFVPADLQNQRAQHMALTHEKVQKRLSANFERPDFIGSMLRKKGPGELTFEELKFNSSTLITAGSETTATALSAITYYILSNTDSLKKLNAEVRNAFASEDDIGMVSVQKLVYMQAVINEGLRMYPPVPSGIVRRVTDDGGVFLGQYVPSGKYETLTHPARHLCKFGTGLHTIAPKTSLFLIPSFLNAGLMTLVLQATTRMGFNLSRLDPEIALEESEYPSSCYPSHVLLSFDCRANLNLSSSLAYAEMRLILARIIWNFDMALDEASRGWDEKSQVYLLWEKGPVNVFLSPRTIGPEHVTEK